MRFVVATQSSNLNVRSGPGPSWPVVRRVGTAGSVDHQATGGGAGQRYRRKGLPLDVFGNRHVADRLSETLKEVYRQFGLKARLAGPVIGRIIHVMLKREDRRLAAGWTWEPPTFYERNYNQPGDSSARMARWVVAGESSEAPTAVAQAVAQAQPAAVG